MKNILWLHHVQDMWRDNVAQHINPEQYLDNIKDYIYSERNNLDFVILTSYENIRPDETQIEIISLLDHLNISYEHFEYGYNFTRDLSDRNQVEEYNNDNFNKTWCYGTRSHHRSEGDEQDILLIDDWMREHFSGNNILLAGAFENECLLDAETILDVMQVDFEKINELSVGNGCENYYESKLNNHEIISFFKHIEAEISSKINEIENKLKEDIETIGYNISADTDDKVELLFSLDTKFKEYIEDKIEYFLQENDEILNIFDLTGFNVGQHIDLFYQVFNDNIETDWIDFRTFDNIEDNYDSFYIYSRHKDVFDNVDINSIDSIEEFWEQYGKEQGISILTAIKNDLSVIDPYQVCINQFDFIIEELNEHTPQELFTIFFDSTVDSVKGVHYHGTYIEDINDIFDFNILDTQFSDNNCTYLSNSESVADNFANKEFGIAIVLKIDNFDMDKLFFIEENSQTFYIDGSEYSISDDREDYFEHLSRLGYNGCLIKNNYGTNESDLALFNNVDLDELDVTAKVFKNNEWSDYMSFNDLANSLNKKTKKRLAI